MDKNKNMELDTFLKKVVKEVGLEEPSINFTKSVLSKIEVVSEQGSVVRYKPLIPKWAWWILATAVIGIFTYMIFGNTTTEISWLSGLRLDKFSAYDFFDKIPVIDIPDTFVYGFLGLAFFVYVQVFLLRHHFDKKYFLD